MKTFLEFEFGADTSGMTLKRQISITSARLEEATLAKGWFAKRSLRFGSPGWPCGGGMGALLVLISRGARGDEQIGCLTSVANVLS